MAWGNSGNKKCPMERPQHCSNCKKKPSYLIEKLFEQFKFGWLTISTGFQAPPPPKKPPLPASHPRWGLLGHLLGSRTHSRFCMLGCTPEGAQRPPFEGGSIFCAKAAVTRAAPSARERAREEEEAPGIHLLLLLLPTQPGPGQGLLTTAVVGPLNIPSRNVPSPPGCAVLMWQVTQRVV